MSSVISILICMSPVLVFAIGYWIGRYGLPIEIRRRKIEDRRRKIEEVSEDEPEPEITRSQLDNLRRIRG